MIQKIIRAMIGIFGFVLGFTIYSSLASTFPVLLFGIKKGTILISAVVGLIIGVIFYIIGPWVIDRFKYIAKLMDKEISKYPQTDILLGSIGLIIGFVIAYLLGGLINSIPIVGGILTFITYGFLGYLGIKIALKSKDDLFNISRLYRLSPSIKEKSTKKEGKTIPPKVLDTSVIIDGRIADICKTGFIEGKLIIPKFVLDELQHIADSSDDLKRVRGRRGLDILNINELANAIKPVAIPGEEMIVQVVKEGKEHSQGIAYLDDGTMIVVDGGKKHMGETIRVLVTSVLQTPAGRMIFGKPKN